MFCNFQNFDVQCVRVNGKGGAVLGNKAVLGKNKTAEGVIVLAGKVDVQRFKDFLQLCTAINFPGIGV